MDNFPINKAHQLDRRAALFLKQKKFDECIECHKAATKHLHEALQMTENAMARDSIHLQVDSHQKTVDHLRIKKAQWEEVQRQRAAVRQRCANYDSIYEEEGATTLQTELFRTMENHDSLIMELLKRGADDESLKSYSTSDDTDDAVDGGRSYGVRKRQVDDSVVIEEYKGLSEKLKELVQILLVQLEDKDAEIGRLKERITRLETEKAKGTIKTNNTLKVVTDSSGGTSPYVYSPCSELSPEVVHDVNSLPILAPLEMPTFDFTQLMLNAKDTNDSNNTNNN